MRTPSASGDTAQLHYSVWPGTPLPLPAVQQYDVEQLPGGWLYPRTRYDGSEPAVQLPPPDFHLFDLADVDLHDPKAIAALTERVGLLTPWVPSDEPNDVPGKAYARSLAVFCSVLGLPSPILSDRGDSFRVHFTEIAFRVQAVRRLVSHVAALSGGQPVSSAWRDCHTDAAAWDNFLSIINTALQPFHVGVTARLGDRQLYSGMSTPSAYQVACLAIANDLADRAPYRTCADETCRRIFARQVGGSRYYTRRDGVMYCTPGHARAQAQRESRRRKRQERQQQRGTDGG